MKTRLILLMTAVICVVSIAGCGGPNYPELIYSGCDEAVNFLMEYYVGTTLMNQPSFYRAVDTKDKDIEASAFIDELGYGFWK